MNKRKNRPSHPLVIKLSGGLTAQLLALMSAIYLSKKFSRSFTIRYFPFSTGTFWPLEINPLLAVTELVEIRETRGISSKENLARGEHIPDFPLRRKGLSYERSLQILHRLRLDVPLRRLRGEYVIGGKVSRLKKIPKSAYSVSGNFPPLLDLEVMSDLSKRIDHSGLPNPFKPINPKKFILIHYRLGDMRKMPARNPQFGGHGVVDPLVFKEIVHSFENRFEDFTVKFVSDEPVIALKLLEEVGFANLEDVSSGNVWKDLETIASAQLFIGSSSQFSVLGALLCSKNGGTSILPSSNYGVGEVKSDFGVEEFSFYEYRYLKANHWIFRQI